MKNTFVVIKNFKFLNFKKDGIRNLNKNKFKTSPWINDIIKKNNYNLKNYELPVWVVKISVKDLGFKKPTELKKIYKKAIKKNLKLVPPAIALYLRIVYKNQKVGEWIRIATPLYSMIDSDNVPHLPKLGYALKNYFLETYWSYPKAIFHPNNEFIFLLK